MKKKWMQMAAVILSIVMLTGCGSTKVYKTGINGYTKIYDAIPDFGFEISSELLEKSTAITSLNGGDYSDGTFCYKNGSDTYIIFNIKWYVIAVGRNTTFGFTNEASVPQNLEQNSLQGIWFSPEKKLNFTQEKKKDAVKTVMNVIGEVSITEDLFGTFTGTLSTIATDEGECSLFMGIAGTSYEEISKNNKKLINNICGSFVTVDNAERFEVVEANTEEQEMLAVVENGANKDTIGAKAGKTDAVDVNTEYLHPKTTERDTASEPWEEKTELPEKSEPDEEDVIVVKETGETASEVDTESETENEPDALEDRGEMANGNSSSKDGKKPTVSETVGSSITVIKGGDSTIYRQLEIGSVGTLSGFTSGRKESQMSMRLDAIYKGNEAQELLKKLEGKDDKIVGIQAPPGTSFEIAEYALSKNPNTDYVNIRMVGLDGDNLIYRGVSYNKRTYDCFRELNYKDGMYEKLYCIYAVPNGCTEYTLACGDAAYQNMAYFHVQ